MPGTCRQIAMAAGYQCTSHSKNTLQMTSFCAPTIAPFLQPSALRHLQRGMNLLPARQSSALLLQHNVAARKVSGRLAVTCCSFKLHCCAQAAAASWTTVTLFCQSVGPTTRPKGKNKHLDHLDHFRNRYLQFCI